MTQTNVETGVARAVRRGGESGKPPKLQKTSSGNHAAAKWTWQDDDDNWQDFNAEDSLMLEEQYLERGPKAVFKTKDFPSSSPA